MMSNVIKMLSPKPIAAAVLLLQPQPVVVLCSISLV